MMAAVLPKTTDPYSCTKLLISDYQRHYTVLASHMYIFVVELVLVSCILLVVFYYSYPSRILHWKRMNSINIFLFLYFTSMLEIVLRYFYYLILSKFSQNDLCSPLFLSTLCWGLARASLPPLLEQLCYRTALHLVLLRVLRLLCACHALWHFSFMLFYC